MKNEQEKGKEKDQCDQTFDQKEKKTQKKMK